MNNTAAKWTRYGRWTDDGLDCFALIDHRQSRHPYTTDRVIFTLIKPKPEPIEEAPLCLNIF